MVASDCTCSSLLKIYFFHALKPLGIISKKLVKIFCYDLEIFFIFTGIMIRIRIRIGKITWIRIRNTATYGFFYSLIFSQKGRYRVRYLPNLTDSWQLQNPLMVRYIQRYLLQTLMNNCILTQGTNCWAWDIPQLQNPTSLSRDRHSSRWPIYPHLFFFSWTITNVAIWFRMAA